MEKYYAYIVFDWFSGNKLEYGIVRTWKECKDKTYKVKGSRFKSFNTIEEATRWVEDPAIKSKDEKYYAVYSELVSENKIFQDYPRLKAIIECHQENNLPIKFKSFKCKEDAEKWLNDLSGT